MGRSIQEWTKSNLWKTAFKKFEVTKLFLKKLLQEIYDSGSNVQVELKQSLFLITS